MTFRLVPAGATITRTYLAVPEYASIGREFENTDDGWDAAVEYAQAKLARIIEANTKSLGQFGNAEDIERGADVQVSIDVRWKIDYPNGGGIDLAVERIKHVANLRKAVRR